MEKENEVSVFLEDDLDLKSANNEQLRMEVLKWRRTAPSMIKILGELNQYRALAPSPQHINDLFDQMQATITTQNIQIEEMMVAIEQMYEEPIGPDSRAGKKTTKKVVH